jgi:hypothetical protein
MHLPLENAGIFRNFKSYLKFVKIYAFTFRKCRNFQKFQIVFEICENLCIYL